MSEVKVSLSPKEPAEPLKTDFEQAYKALIKVLNDYDVDARTAIHLAQDIITNATVALVADIYDT